ncbi:hypothetical protein KIN20_002473 [Parelaphostrongylus tenuis]|uniref:Uncharacterized protein n=1 Tax=Parelaphostrongylus tenuis TaxID=148309 RepID=A0AAD5ME92_PARTN|nr:hypothetical protein KIN20_002473 [Parelaphostrongylus tenuis]
MFSLQMSKQDVFARKVWVLRRKPESLNITGEGARPEWQSYRNDQVVGQTGSEGRARPVWSPIAVKEEHSFQPSDTQLQHVVVPQADRAYPSDIERDQMDPNAILEIKRERVQTAPDSLRKVQSQSENMNQNAVRDDQRSPPEWETRTETRTKVYDDTDLQSRNHVRFRYVRPEVVKTDQYGRPYKPPVGDGVEEQPTDSTTVDWRRISEYDQNRSQDQSPKIDSMRPCYVLTKNDDKRPSFKKDKGISSIKQMIVNGLMKRIPQLSATQ